MINKKPLKEIRVQVAVSVFKFVYIKGRICNSIQPKARFNVFGDDCEIQTFLENEFLSTSYKITYTIFGFPQFSQYCLRTIFTEIRLFCIVAATFRQNSRFHFTFLCIYIRVYEIKYKTGIYQ